MVGSKAFKGHKIWNTAERTKAPGPLILSSTTKAFRKLTPSKRSLLTMLSSAALMHPEIPLDIRQATSPLTTANDGNERNVETPLLLAEPFSPSPSSSKYSVNETRDDYDTVSPPQSTVSSQRPLTFPPATKTLYRSQSSLELPRNNNPWFTQTVFGVGQGTIISDSTRSGIETLLRSFSDEPIHIHGSRMIHRHDLPAMIELHMLSWREDRFVQRLQRNQIPRAEIQTMRAMLADRTISSLDNVLVARINNSHNPKDIVGWLSCSIIRMNTRGRQMAVDNGTRALEWNLATAVNLNKSYNAGSKIYLFGRPGSLKGRNELIEVLCKSTRWSQMTEFRDQVRNFQSTPAGAVNVESMHHEGLTRDYFIPSLNAVSHLLELLLPFTPNDFAD